MRSPAEASDEEDLWSRAVSGDRDALGLLLVRHAGRIRDAARSAGLGEADASDAVQETFVRALVHWRDLRGQGALGAWLQQIARRIVIDWHRRRARPLSDRMVIRHRPRETPSLSDELGGLPVEARDLLRMRYLEGLTGVEMASRLGLSIETIKKRLQRARAAALEWLRRRGVVAP